MRIGAHVSTRSPFSDAIIRAKEIGCECMQVFVNAPQRWDPLEIPDREIEEFKSKNSKENIKPVIIHSIYLINLASNNPFFYEASIKSIIDDMQKAEKIGAAGVNFHVGSTKGSDFESVLPKVVEAINIILRESPVAPYLLLENSAGSGNIIGDTVEELAKIINSVESDRLKITIDTAHAFASGYDVRGDRFNNLLEKIDKSIGLNKLACIHLNDSMVDLNSKRDRHADIGEGFIGIDAFRNIINHPLMRDIPGIIETPGNKGKSDVNNLAILKELRV